MSQKHSSSGRGDHYRALLAEKEGSGLSLRAFAAQRGLSPWPLYDWRQRLAQSMPKKAAARARGPEGFARWTSSADVLVRAIRRALRSCSRAAAACWRRATLRWSVFDTTGPRGTFDWSAELDGRARVEVRYEKLLLILNGLDGDALCERKRWRRAR